MWMCITEKNEIFRECAFQKYFLINFFMDQIVCASLECLFFGKNMVIDNVNC